MSRPSTLSQASTRGGASASRTARASNGDVNVIGASVRVRGRVTGEGDVRIEGQIEGDVRVTGALTLDAKASVKGNASARSVDVEGTLRGDIAAEGAVSIKDGAHVEGNISGAEVALDEGASFVGRIE